MQKVFKSSLHYPQSNEKLTHCLLFLS